LLPHDQWGYLAEYNRVIGGLRISQHRSESHTCHYSKLNEFYGECQPLGTTDTNSFGYPDCSDLDAVEQYDEKYGSADDDTLVRTCFNTSEYQHVVDLYNDEGFTYDTTTEQFEMCVTLSIHSLEKVRSC
jgi:hypothetical protein